MQAVRQLDDDDTDVLCHGEEHFPQVFRLHLQLILGIGQPSQLCHPVHQEGHLVPKFPCNVLLRQLGVFHHVVQHPGHDGLLVHLKFRQDDSHPEGMDDIGFPRLAPLLLVRVARGLVSF